MNKQVTPPTNSPTSENETLEDKLERVSSLSEEVLEQLNKDDDQVLPKESLN
jgi:hypothetical protein